jgi:ubiquinone/menaquinone biosynthesis C-methylase UbiE
MTSSPDPLALTVSAYEHDATAYAGHSRDRAHLRRLHEKFRACFEPGARVLDLGCGPGHDAAVLAALGLSATGFDPTRGLLIEAQAHGSISGALVQGDARLLPLAGGSFDGIWACASLLHVPKQDIPVALSEAFRILCNGGVIFTSMSEGPQSEAVPVVSDGLQERMYYYHSGGEWAAAVEAAGFAVLEHDVRRDAGNFNPGSTGWIETFARKP